MLDVEQDQIRARRAAPPSSAAAPVGGLDERDAAVLEGEANQLDDWRLIVGDQDGRHGPGPAAQRHASECMPTRKCRGVAARQRRGYCPGLVSSAAGSAQAAAANGAAGRAAALSVAATSAWPAVMSAPRRARARPGARVVDLLGRAARARPPAAARRARWRARRAPRSISSGRSAVSARMITLSPRTSANPPRHRQVVLVSRPSGT